MYKEADSSITELGLATFKAWLCSTQLHPVLFEWLCQRLKGSLVLVRMW